MSVVVLFRNDDLSGASDVDHEYRIASMFDKYNITQTLGVVPIYPADSVHEKNGTRGVTLESNVSMVNLLCNMINKSRCKIALHGYLHRTNRLSNPSRREYFEFNGLPLEEQEERIRKGTLMIEKIFGFRPVTFIPPWNRMDKNTLTACVSNGYRIVSAGPFTPFISGLVPFGVDCDLSSFPRLFNSSLSSNNRIFIRVIYHSNKLCTEEKIRELDEVLRLIAENPDCENMTISDAVLQHTDEILMLNEAARYALPQEDFKDTVRGRIRITSRLFWFLSQAKRIERFISQARDYYREGEYNKACALNKEIVSTCEKLILQSRIITVITGFVCSLLLFILMSHFPHFYKLLYFVLTLFAGLSALSWWIATARDTRREILLFALLWLVGGIIGFVLYKSV